VMIRKIRNGLKQFVVKAISLSKKPMAFKLV
jgi:hypothetical protein